MHLAFGIALFVATLTLFLLRETRRLRKASTEPKIEVYLVPDGLRPASKINMVVRNSGNGPAMNIKWWIMADEQDLIRRDIPLLNMALFKTLHYLPAKEEIRFSFGSAEKMFGPYKMEPIKIDVVYQSEDGTTYRPEPFDINVEQFAGMEIVPEGSNAQASV